MEEIFDTYYEKIYYWSLNKTRNKEDALDLTNDIFVAIFQYINKNIKIDRLENLIWKIATNIWNQKAVKYIKEKNNVEYDVNTSSYDENYIDKVIYKEIIENIDNYYSLTDKEKLCFKYFYFDDLSIKEIVDKMQSTESNIKYYLYSARNKIKEDYYD